jgi:hypothetical protein
MTFILKNFDISKINEKSVIIILGRCNSGKNTICTNIIDQHEESRISVITHKNKSRYENYTPSEFIYNANNCDSVINKLTDIMETHKSNKSSEILIFDPLIHNKNNFFNENVVMELFCNKRFHDLLTIFNLHCHLIVPVELRRHVDYIFILKEDFVSFRKLIYEKYARMLPTFKDFCDIMDKYTKNFGCIVINNTTQNNKVEDMIFWYNANEDIDANDVDSNDIDTNDIYSEEEINNKINLFDRIDLMIKIRSINEEIKYKL